MTPRVSLKFMAGLILLFTPWLAHAHLSTNLQSLITEHTAINQELNSITIAQGDSCTQLGSLNTTIEDYIASIEMVSGQLNTAVSLSSTDLDALDTLSQLSRASADDAVRVALELRDIENLYSLFEYRAALSAMLQLSTDIGTMADRILEMASRILVMADNIGAMADRILLTQQLQNSNILLIQSALLSTQQNMIAMSDSVSSIMYNLTLDQLSSDTQALLDDMNALTLDRFNMSTELAAIQSQTTLLLNQTINLYVWATQNSQLASHYINGDTLTLLGDLSTIHKALAMALNGYASAIQSLSPYTDNIILGDATAAMLSLTRDIGLMSDRILQMSDNIIVMADNVGLMSDRIVTTQNLQQDNIDLTRDSIITAQNTTINLIQNLGL